MSTPELLRGEGLPHFEAIDAEQVNNEIPALLTSLNDQLKSLETSLQQRLDSASPLGWDELMPSLHQLGERLRWSWGVVSHLNGVCNSAELRAAPHRLT